MSKRFNAAIIGAGSIGGLIDFPHSQHIASHAHAYTKESSCSLVAICEPNKVNQEEFQKKWGKVHIYETIPSLLEQENIHILSIASPTHFHAENLQDVLHSNSVIHILCEKPLVDSYDKFQSISPQLQTSNKKVLINFIRRYDPSFIALSEFLREKKLGRVISFHGTCNKGLLHNGSHMLALVQHLIGSLTEIECVNPISLKNDLCGNFMIHCDNATKGSLSCLNSSEYSIFELDIWLNGGKIQIKEGGSSITIYTKEASKVYAGYFELRYSHTLENTLKHYATHSLRFLLQSDAKECKKILNEHLSLHEMIFQTLKKEGIQ